MIWVSVQTARDILQTYLLLSLVSLWLPIKQTQNFFSILRNLLVSIILIIFMWEIRKAQALLALLFVIIFVSSKFDSLYLKENKILKVILIVIYILSVLGFFIFIDFNIAFFLSSVETYTELRIDNTTGSGLSSVVFNSPFFPFGWILRISYALISPVPLIFKPLDNLFLSVGTIIHILFIPFLWLGIRNSFTSRDWNYIAFVFVSLFFGMVFFTFTIRHMVQFLPFGILLTAIGYQKYQGNRMHIFFSVIIFSALLLFTYLLIS